MLKRPFKSLIARIAIIALALSLVVPFVPAAFAQDTSLNYAENATGPVAAFTATDQDGDPIVWSLAESGNHKLFTIDGGVLAFKKSPNYEDSKSGITGGTQADRNVYNVTIVANGDSQDVAVQVTDVDEDGKVTLTQVQPQVSRSLLADLVDPDSGQSDEVWQWARSEDGTTWADIEGAASQSRRPVEADIGNWLRATVVYADSFGADKTASVVSMNKVEARTLANAAPSFADLDETTGDDDIIVTRMVNEYTDPDVSIGNLISASDTDNDVLIYTLSGKDAEKFSINAGTGQLKTKAELESDNKDDDKDNSNVTIHTVTVTATDPSGAVATQEVTITVVDTNQSPVFGSAALKTLWVLENSDILRTGEAADADPIDEDTYRATDKDTGDNTIVVYTVTGADKKYFVAPIGDGKQALAFISTHEPDYEKKSSYSITIVAKSGEGERQRTSTQDVTVKVDDGEDPGKVGLSQREPQIGRTVVATLTDVDGGITVSGWQWWKSKVLEKDDTCATEKLTFNKIEKALSAAYTPKAADVNTCLRATATYTDNILGDADPKDNTDNDGNDETDKNLDGVAVSETTDAAVQVSAADNTAPLFPDQDPGTAGDQSDETSRSVAENTEAGQSVGAALTADDGDGDLMQYTLGGADADAFDISRSNGQVSTKAELDYESKTTYIVVVTATDPSGAADSILVTINVTNEDDSAVIQLNVAPAFAEDSADRSVAENSEAGTAVGDPVTATDANAGDSLTYALSGGGAGSFSIDASGQISVGADTALDFESMAGYTVTVTATDRADATDSITVTINVTNVNEAPAASGEATVDYAENGTGPVGTYSATDPDNGDAITWSLSGADAGSFSISEDGILSFAAPAIEEESDDANGDDANGDDANGDDANGEDANGDDANGDDANGDDANGDDANGDDANGDDANGDDANGDDASAEAVASPNFEEPGDADGDNVYEVTVTATDSSGASSYVMVSVTVTDVDENNAPAFETDAVTFSVDENSEAMTAVGDPVVATDADGDELIYSLSGDGAAAFEIWPSGQITVAEGAALDYETKTSYSVTVTATDAAGASDSVEVTIAVNDLGLSNAYDSDDSGDIDKDEAVQAVQDYFADTITRGEVLEVLQLYFAG